MDNTVSLKNREEKRIIYFDLLRIFATLAVVMIHCSASKLSNWSPFELNWQICSFLNSISRWSVPVFVMISGALFLKGEHSIEKLLKKNVLRIATAFLFWTVIYGLFKLFVRKSGIKLAIGEMIVGHYHLWFMFMIAGLYLAVPLLKKITESEKLTKYFLILSLIFAFIIPSVTGVISLFSESIAASVTKITENIDFRIAVGYSGYFVLGYFLSKAELNKKQRTIIYIISAAGFILTAGLSVAFSCLKNTTVEVFYGYFSVTVLAEAAGVFTFFRYADTIISKKKQTLILDLSKYSFGVYLVHPLILETLDCVFGITVSSGSSLAVLPVIYVIVIVLSFCISALLNKIPVVNKYIV